MFYRYLVILTLILISIFSAHAQPYYADIELEVDSTGTTTITGLSNIPSLRTPLTTNEFTSKKGSIWTFNLTTPEEVDSFVFELTLPEGANINYIKTTPSFRLEDSNGKLRVIGSGDNKPMTIIIQYSLNSSNNDSIPFLVLAGIFVIVGLISGYFVSKFLSKNKNSTEDEKEPIKEDNLGPDLTLLSPRQKEIMEILLKEGRITQKQLEGLVSIPKSSLSRNLKTLEVKGYIKKEQIGQTNYIIIL